MSLWLGWSPLDTFAPFPFFFNKPRKSKIRLCCRRHMGITVFKPRISNPPPPPASSPAAADNSLLLDRYIFLRCGIEQNSLALAIDRFDSCPAIIPYWFLNPSRVGRHLSFIHSILTSSISTQNAISVMFPINRHLLVAEYRAPYTCMVSLLVYLKGTREPPLLTFGV